MGEAEKPAETQPDAKPAPEKEPAPAENRNFFLVILPDDADAAPQVHSSTSVEGFSALVTEHVLGATAPIHAYAFEGRRIPISTPSASCSIKLGDEAVAVGQKTHNFEENGYIVPLKGADK